MHMYKNPFMFFLIFPYLYQENLLNHGNNEGTSETEI